MKKKKKKPVTFYFLWNNNKNNYITNGNRSFDPRWYNSNNKPKIIKNIMYTSMDNIIKTKTIQKKNLAEIILSSCRGDILEHNDSQVFGRCKNN